MSNKLPPALIRKLKDEFALEDELFIETHRKGQSITSVRINPSKDTGQFDGMEQVPWCDTGYYLPERPAFTADPFFHAGCYYVQEASSMFLAHALKRAAGLDQDLNVLDLCAAPGGKSTLINSLISSGSMLVANEIIKTRVPVLTDNLTRWGYSNSYVSNNDPRDFGRLPAFFDILIVDAPCSGSGMFRKDPSAIDEWSESAVKLCSERQKRILADSLGCLAADGILVYSTCSYSKEENEAICDWLIEEHQLQPIPIPVPPEWGIVESLSDVHRCPGYRFYPHKLEGEGFFIACFKKTSGSEAPVLKPNKNRPKANHAALLDNWLAQPDHLLISERNKELFALPSTHAERLELLQKNLYLKKSGIRLGSLAGKDLVPDHELAMSSLLRRDIPAVELGYEDAIKYLRKDSFNIDSNLKGWCLMRYKGVNLGWAKILPNRVNNYYPKEIRILKEL